MLSALNRRRVWRLLHRIGLVELVGDPGFDNSGYWTKDTGVTVSGGKAIWTAVATNFALFRAAAGAVNGRPYTVKFTIDSISAGGIKAAVGNTFGTVRTAPGTYTEVITASNASGTIGLYSSGASTTAQCDDFSVVG